MASEVGDLNKNAQRLLAKTAFRGSDRGNTEGYRANREWTLLLICCTFVLLGLVLLPSEPGLALLGLVLFGYGLIYFPMRILERKRLARPAPLQVGIIGGVPIRSSRVTLATFAGWMTVTGIVGTTYFLVGDVGAHGKYAAVIGCIAFAIFAAYGCYWLVGLITGRWPNEYIQFDPSAISIGDGPWSYAVPWDNIVSIDATEISDNIYVLISLDPNKSIIVDPGESSRRVSRLFARNRRSTGADVAINSAHFRLNAQFLMHALGRYVTQPSARAELAKRQIGQP